MKRAYSAGMSHSIVLFDPKNSLPPGAVLETGNRACELAVMRGAVVLPVDADLLQLGNGAAGFAARAWGYGVSFEGNKAVRGCPLLLYVFPDRPMLHWAARLQVVNGALPRGNLRLVQNATQPGAPMGGLGATAPAIDLGQLGEPDAGQGWMVRGMCTVHTREQGYMGLLLQAVATNLRITFSAVTQSRE